MATPLEEAAAYRLYVETLERGTDLSKRDRALVTDAVRSLLLTLCPECRDSVEVRLLRRLTGT